MSALTLLPSGSSTVLVVPTAVSGGFQTIYADLQIVERRFDQSAASHVLAQDVHSAKTYEVRTPPMTESAVDTLMNVLTGLDVVTVSGTLVDAPVVCRVRSPRKQIGVLRNQEVVTFALEEVDP